MILSSDSCPSAADEQLSDDKVMGGKRLRWGWGDVTKNYSLHDTYVTFVTTYQQFSGYVEWDATQ